jgi:hypothetical protein
MHPVENYRETHTEIVCSHGTAIGTLSKGTSDITGVKTIIYVEILSPSLVPYFTYIGGIIAAR